MLLSPKHSLLKQKGKNSGSKTAPTSWTLSPFIEKRELTPDLQRLSQAEMVTGKQWALLFKGGNQAEGTVGWTTGDQGRMGAGKQGSGQAERLRREVPTDCQGCWILARENGKPLKVSQQGQDTTEATF